MSEPLDIGGIEDLTKEGALFRGLLDSIFDGVYVVDTKRRILLWNRGCEELTGYPSSEVMGRSCADDILNHIDENGELLCRKRCPILRCLRDGSRITAKVYPKHKAGRRFPVETHIAPIRNREGKIIAAVEVFRDVTLQEDYKALQEKFNRIARRYLSESAFEQIMEQAQTGAAGSARSLDGTIVYLDIVGFTPLTEKRTPEEVVGILNHVFGICDVITREHHGDIDKFIGDAMLCVFVDANDAVRAAEKIAHEALPQYNALRREGGEEPVRVRIGINSGVVFQGDVGAADRKDLTVIGDAVNVTERIERLSPPGTFLISEATYARLEPDLAARFAFREEVTVKGKAEPIRVYGLKK